MRGISLRLKINLAILLAFLAAAGAFGTVLRLNMETRLHQAHDRARVLLAAVAAHRLVALIPLLEQGHDLDGVKAVLDRLLRVDTVKEAALFDPKGSLLAQVGADRIDPLLSGAVTTLPVNRHFSVATAQDRFMAAIAVHTFKGAAATLGAYSCRELAVGLEKSVRAGEIETAKAQLAHLTALWASVSQARAAWQVPRDDQDPA